MGEFQGEDDGSPVIARWRAEAAQLTRCHTGSIARNNIVEATRYDVSNMPLETMEVMFSSQYADAETDEPSQIRVMVSQIAEKQLITAGDTSALMTIANIVYDPAFYETDMSDDQRLSQTATRSNHMQWYCYPTI